MPFTSSTSEPAIDLDPQTTSTKKAIAITKKFIADRRLVCYGGTALDYAARLQGGRIYDDEKLALPDLDFYSADPLKDARDLADILYLDGYEEARVINALHVGTFRVDCGGNHFIADVSYFPILESLKVVTYEGFRVVHPDYQRLDTHSSLSFVYDNPPREVAFARVSKDIERFNIINALYPLPTPSSSTTSPLTSQASSSTSSTSKIMLSKDYVYAGLTAYKLHTLSSPISSDISSDIIEIVSHSPRELIADMGMEIIAEYDQLVNIFPVMFFTKTTDGKRFIIYDTTHRLLSINTREHTRFACANYTLRCLLAWHLVFSGSSASLGGLDKMMSIVNSYPYHPDPAICLAAYHDLLPRATLSEKYYGDENIDHAAIIKAAEYDKILGESSDMSDYYLPPTYRPSKNPDVARGKRDDKDDKNVYVKNVFFHIAGQKR